MNPDRIGSTRLSDLAFQAMGSLLGRAGRRPNLVLPPKQIDQNAAVRETIGVARAEMTYLSNKIFEAKGHPSSESATENAPIPEARAASRRKISPAPISSPPNLAT
jgi:hypothetical protein